jgi:hypothetical protein
LSILPFAIFGIHSCAVIWLVAPFGLSFMRSIDIYSLSWMFLLIFNAIVSILFYRKATVKLNATVRWPRQGT